VQRAEAGRWARPWPAATPEPHTVRTDAALYDYRRWTSLRHMRQSGPVSLVVYDAKLKVLTQALHHTTIARVQGGKLKAKREIRVASLFRDAPADFLHDRRARAGPPQGARARQGLLRPSSHMAPDYHQLEFDTRLWLLALQWAPAPARRTALVPGLTQGDPMPGSARAGALIYAKDMNRLAVFMRRGHAHPACHGRADGHRIGRLPDGVACAAAGLCRAGADQHLPLGAR
jgi:hypothetical protein